MHTHIRSCMYTPTHRHTQTHNQHFHTHLHIPSYTPAHTPVCTPYPGHTPVYILTHILTGTHSHVHTAACTLITLPLCNPQPELGSQALGLQDVWVKKWIQSQGKVPWVRELGKQVCANTMGKFQSPRV